MINKFFLLKLILFTSLLDTFAILLLLILYITGYDFLDFVKINFLFSFVVLIFSLFHKWRVDRYIYFFIFIFFISIIKLLVAVLSSTALNNYFIINYFYSLIMPILCFAFVSRFTLLDYEKVYLYIKKYAKYYLVLSSIFLSIYICCYFSGIVSYFGLGTNMHYAMPFFFKSNIIVFLLFIIILLSGKRAVFINAIVQYSIYYFIKKKHKIFVYLAFIFIAVALLLLSEFTNLLDRIKFISNVNFNDSYSLLLAFSGRFEEITGIINFYLNNNLKIYLGAAPGEYYYWIIESYGSNEAYNEIKNYSHLMIFSFLFRYGLLPTFLIYIYLFVHVIKYKSKKVFYLIFVGIVISSFFGANLLNDPIGWIFIAFFFKYKKYQCE